MDIPPLINIFSTVFSVAVFRVSTGIPGDGSMITIYSYDIAKGLLERPTPEALPELLDREDVDLWVDLDEPTPGESEILRTVFNFHELESRTVPRLILRKQSWTITRIICSS